RAPLRPPPAHARARRPRAVGEGHGRDMGKALSRDPARAAGWPEAACAPAACAVAPLQPVVPGACAVGGGSSGSQDLFVRRWQRRPGAELPAPQCGDLALREADEGVPAEVEINAEIEAEIAKRRPQTAEEARQCAGTPAGGHVLLEAAAATPGALGTTSAVSLSTGSCELVEDPALDKQALEIEAE
ncbi:unnamed protein product, partial [Prorocentrum cordatum]